MWNLKINTNELIYKTETDSQIQKANLKMLKELKEDMEKVKKAQYKQNGNNSKETEKNKETKKKLQSHFVLPIQLKRLIH